MPLKCVAELSPFIATDDPRVLGIEPIPNIQEKISAMIQMYRAETLDIEDVQLEEVDLELSELFPILDKAHGEHQPEAGVSFSEPKSIDTFIRAQSQRRKYTN